MTVTVNYPTMDGKPMPPVPGTIAEMLPVRQAEIAARKAPLCSQYKSHGRMRPVPLEDQNYERMYCGVHYECGKRTPAGDHCPGNTAWYSRELSAYHGMPYVVDSTHSEMWDGSAWQPITEQEAAQYWAERITGLERREAIRLTTGKRRRRTVAKR